MDVRKLAEFDRKAATIICLKEDITAACKSLHLAALRIERGDFANEEQLAGHYQFIVETHTALGSKLQKLGLLSGAVSVVPVGGNGKVAVAGEN